MGQEVKVSGYGTGDTFAGDKSSWHIAALSITILTMRIAQEVIKAQEEVRTGLLGRSERDVCAKSQISLLTPHEWEITSSPR